MTREEIIEAIQYDNMMPFLQDWEVRDVVDFVLKNIRPELPEGLEKAAGEYAVDNAQYYYEDDDNAICSTADILKPAFIAGAEWGMNQCPLPEDTTIFLKGVAEGKRLMMEEAVEGVARPDDCEIWVNLVGYGYKFKDGDKVKVIVIKED